jgi:membrane protein implicated in regulation of membrane protease activity
MRGAALLTALVAAAALPAGPPGIGIPIVAALVGVTVLTRARPSLDLLLFGVLAIALAASAAALDADWVVALDLATCILLATVAVGGVRLTAPLAPIAALNELPALAPRPGERGLPVLRGALAGCLLVVPFGALFWTGDAAFAALGDSLPIPSLDSLPEQSVTFALVLVATVGLTVATQRRRETPSVDVPRRPLLEWALPLVALDALYLVFVGVQAGVLFAGSDYVNRTTGLTYAEYAREGFWQLLAAATLTLVVIAAAVMFAHTRSRTERRILRVLLGLLAALTLLTVTSALHRLRLYETAFGLTRLRLFAEAFAVWLGGVFVLLLIAGALVAVRRHLARIALAATALALVVFATLSPDRVIAQRNIQRWHDTGRLDIAYLRTLSADAVPALTSLPQPLRSQALAPLARRLAKDEPWSSANLSRHRARALLGERSARPVSREGDRRSTPRAAP